VAQKLVVILQMTIGGIAFLFFLGFGIGSSIVAPDHAIVLIDTSNMTYIAPPCATEKTRSLPRRPLGDARRQKFNPDPACRDASGFVQEERSLSGHFLERVGLLPKLNSRWNADGSWNW
jgi:hypothetical protein